MAELKPCPFCGGEARLRKDEYRNFWVECKNCLCGTSFASGSSPDEKLIETVIQDWNRRVSDGK